ncbi:MAG: chalcone isomerase family protein [Rickettsiales bacterium]|nr:chalcone isomerase family protein [Rickettsiales bacterium]
MTLLFSNQAFAKVVAGDYGYKSCNSHRFTFLLLKVYDSYLCFNSSEFLAPGEIFKSDFSLIIDYDMNFGKEELAKSSIEEINKHYDVNKRVQEKYFTELMMIFPNVKSGDIIEARYFKEGRVEFYHNTKFNGVINEKKFARMFLDIWLHENNDYQGMIEDLYGNVK